MKSLKFFVVSIVVALFLLPSVSRGEGTGKTGFVNLTRVFFEYDKSKELKKALEDKAKQKESDRKKMVDEIKRLKDETELLSEKSRAEKEPQIDQKIRTLQEFDGKTKEEIAKEGSESSQEVLADIESVISDYAKKENFNLIIDAEALLYGEDSINLTDTVIKLLNDGYKNKTLPKSKKEDKK